VIVRSRIPDTLGHKFFYVRNLQMLVIVKIFCPWQAPPP
jgi:hypothetical protein